MTKEKKKCILIVEDEEPQRNAIKEKMSNEGFEILEAHDGEEGLKVALSKHPDLILLDLILPKKDGLTLLKELREDEWGKNARVLVMTNLADPGKEIEAMARSVGDYLVKSNHQLSDVIKKAEQYLQESGITITQPPKGREGERASARGRVLVVDDDRPMREALSEKLSKSGFEVITASNGKEGLDVALQNKPGLILLDIVMPVMDGITMLQELRRDAWGKSAKVIVLTNLNMNEADIEKMLKLKPTKYFTKSNRRLAEIVDVVNEYLGL